VRRLTARPDGAAARHLVAIVADGTLNASFATVALRVASNKLRSALEGGASQVLAGSRPVSGSQPLGAASPSASSVPPPPADSRPVLANSGTSWSKAGAGSSALGSGVAAADPASSAFLVRCAKEMARHVGPMSKVYVAEAVRRVSPEAPFALSSARPLVDDLAAQIEDAKDRTAFRRAVLEQK
jgi:hypothetical protein